MKNCNICGKNLFEQITFSNLFKMNYENHKTCIDNLIFNMEEEVIPIESNIIIYDYIFTVLNEKCITENIGFFYFGKLIEKQLENRNWSMVIFYDGNFEYFIKKYNPYLLFNLSNNPILLISLSKKNTIFLEVI